MVSAVTKLAQNEENKKVMADLGALEILVEMGRTGSDIDINGNTDLDTKCKSGNDLLCKSDLDTVYLTLTCCLMSQASIARIY